ncbi:MAG: carbohydrate kinase family protein [Anaerolineales bacterium]|nr:carbohydrate kinase family protein [Anaerolineales bacterium]
MVDYLIYGKIIIDRVRAADGSDHADLLGGGGPQGLFGARLWHDSVGFLSRSGTDIAPRFVQALAELDVDLAGWARYPDLQTFKGGLVVYDEDEYATRPDTQSPAVFQTENWFTMLGRPLELPAAYERPKAIHLITEFFDEPMVHTALKLKQNGAIFSLEPILDFNTWKNRDGLLTLLPQVDLVLPDWPSASGLAGSQEPLEVLTYWAGLGANVVAIRNGRHGSYVWDRYSGAMWHVPIRPVQAIDPTGAGNSYGAAFCVGWTETRDARQAGCYGTLAAAQIVQTVGMPAEVSPERRAAATAALPELMARIEPLR